jgi:hypothetical protein
MKKMLRKGKSGGGFFKILGVRRKTTFCFPSLLRKLATSGYSRFRCRFIPTFRSGFALSPLRNGYAALRIPNAFPYPLPKVTVPHSKQPEPNHSCEPKPLLPASKVPEPKELRLPGLLPWTKLCLQKLFS